MSKYDPLATFLDAGVAPTVTLSFRQVELILGQPLPLSAREHRAWWGNDTTNHVHSRSWLGAGWRVSDGGLNMQQETVTFVRG